MTRAIPINWRVAALNEVAKVITGTTPSKSSSGYYGPGIPFVTPPDLDQIEPVKETTTTLTEIGAEKAKLLPPGSVMVSCIGTLGKVGQAGTIIATNQQINSLIFDESQVYPRYGFHFCRTLKPILEHIAPSTTLSIVNKSRFQELSITLPPLPEQKRIAAILDKADAIRKKRKLAIELTETFLRSAFLEMFADPVTNPKGWEVQPLEKLLEFLTSGSRGWAKYYAPEGKLFIRIQNVGENELILDDIAFVQPPNNAEARRTVVREGDVILSITADLGRTAVIPDKIGTAYINQHLAILRTKGMEPLYLSAFLASVGGQIQIEKLNRAGVKAGLNFDDIRSLQILMPPHRHQTAWVHVWKAAQKAKRRKEIARLNDENLFDSLVQRAFRGEL